MGYASVFDFLKEDDEFNDIYIDCLSMEKQMIFEFFDMSYVKGRTICEKLIKKIAKNNSKVSYLFSRKKPNGKPYVPGLAETLGACSDKKIISRNISNKYYEIKKVGDAGAHGENIDEYNVNHSKKVHKMVFDITIDCYNEFNYPVKVPYFYRLDQNNKIENTSDDRQEELNSLHLTEVSPDNTKEYYKFKKIFLTIDSFKGCISKYVDKFDKKEEFLSGLEKYSFINDENIDEALSDVETELRTKIKTDVEKLSQEKSEIIIETLNELSDDLTFEELDEIIVSAGDNDKKEIYSFIKELSMNIARKYVSRNKEKLENVPVTYIDENGRKVSKNEKYDIEEDKKGCFLKIQLDEEQKSAVMYNGNKPLVINAGPGSGKTRMLVERIVYLIKKLGTNPSTILAITFTNKAAQELKNRLINDANLPIDVVNAIRITTIYGFCRYLITYYKPVPYNYFNGFHEQFLFFSIFKKELGFTNYAFLYDNWIPRVLELYSKFFNFAVDTEGLIEYIKSRMDNMPKRIISYQRYIDDFHKEYGEDHFPDSNSLRNHKIGHYYHVFLNIASSYPHYKQLLEYNKIFDYDHLLEKAYELLKNENVSRSFRYKNILIDEFQDIDLNQMKIFKILQEICVNKSGTFTIVGDSDQSIYGWRGSSPLFFEDCVTDSNFQLVTIHNNYRSSGNIVKFNEELIKSYRHIEKDSISVKPDGNPVFYLSSLKYDEAENVIQIIKSLKKDNKIKYYSDVSLLFRTNRDIERFLEVFDEHNLPYYSFTKGDFLNQNEVKSMLTLFWLLMPYQKNKFVYRNDDFLNLYWLSDDYFRLSKQTQEILNKIQNNFEESAIRLAREASLMNDKVLRIKKYSSIFRQDEEIINYVYDNIETFDLISLDMQDLIKLGITDIKDLEFFSKLKNLKSIMWDNNLSDSEKPDSLDIFNSLLNITDYFKEVSIRNDENSIKVKDNLALFSKIIHDYGKLTGRCKDYLGLFDYLNMILESYDCPSRDTNERFDKVHLMTMHMAKGLEYPVVILCSLKEEPLSKKFINPFYKIPDYLMGIKSPSVEMNYDEEMKLIYVAATRARDLLILSFINKNNQLPVFLESLMNSNVKIKSLQSYNLTQIQKISSSIINETENVKTLNFEEILSDYLFCPFRYDIFNNTRFSVSVHNQKSVVSGLYRNRDNDWNQMIEIIESYDVIKSDVFLRKQMKNCEIKGYVDMIVKESDTEISTVHFVDSDNKINSFIDEYMNYLHFYTSILKASDEFKGYKFKNIILHSIDNNEVHRIPYQSKVEEKVLNSLEDIATNIVEEKFDKKIYRCVYCECKGNHC